MRYAKAVVLLIFISALMTSCTIFAPQITHVNFGNYEEEPPTTVVPVSRPAEWWPQRHEKTVKRIKEGNVDLLMIGDSITQGWEGAGRNVWNKYYQERNAVNLGFSGDRTEHVIWRLQNGEIDGISPQLAVVMIGTNNIGHNNEAPENTAAGIKTILNELRTRLPHTKILLLAIFPRAADVTQPHRQLVDATNKIIANYADDKQIFFLNINQKFLSQDGTLSTDIMPDLLHPKEKGYDIWAEAMELMIVKLMK